MMVEIEKINREVELEIEMHHRIIPSPISFPTNKRKKNEEDGDEEKTLTSQNHISLPQPPTTSHSTKTSFFPSSPSDSS